MPVTTTYRPTPPVTKTTYLPTPPVTTTTYYPTPPLPVTTFATPPAPGVTFNGCNRDIVFVLDSSGSVGVTNFRRALTFVKDIIHQLHVGPGKAQVAMVTFSSLTQIHWFLNRYTHNGALLAAVDSVRYDSGGTHTSDALKTVREHVFTQASGDRQLAKNVVIVLTDGKSNNAVETIKEAHALHLISGDVITIGVGPGISKPEIQSIATDNHHVFDLQSYSALHTISSDLMRVICNA